MDEGKRAFFIESSELLEEIESSLLVLETSPGNSDAVNSIFRAFHTLKGSSGIIGLDDVESFAHTVENLLERVRQGEVRVTSDLIGLLLDCRDHIANIIPPALEDRGLELYAITEGKRLAELLGEYLGMSPVTAAQPSSPSKKVGEEGKEGELAETDNWHISLRFGPDIMRNGMDPLSFINYLSRLGEVVSLTTIFDAIPPAKDFDPESCYLGFEIDFDSDFDKKSIEDVFEFVYDDCTLKVIPPKSRIESYIQLIQHMPEDPMKLGEILVKGGALTPGELERALQAQNEGKAGGGRSIGEILVDEGMIDSSVLDAAVRKQKSSEKSRELTSIRVDTEKLDYLINLVGEMVIAGANVEQNAGRIKDRDLQQSTSALMRLIDEMRERAMTIRMMPIHDTFSRFQRVVRDFAKESGKEIRLEVYGGDTELDKTVLERIKDPLMHLVRNAADHGLESPEERTAKGKPPEGTIILNAYQETGDVVLEISDNGRGLDMERIRNKALESGIIDPDEELSESEVHRLIFSPGFSTAREVTSISGRGVGMDVVKSNIEALHGTLDLTSKEDMGTTVSIRLPLTLAIIDGFMVRVADSAYVVPMDMVVECLELTAEQRRAAHGRHFVDLRNEVLPYIRLREMFGIEGDLPRYEHILVVRHGTKTVGILVDELHGEIQAVIKSLGRLYREIKGVSGATILGDGTVALILDVPQLVETALELEARYAGKPQTG